MIVNMSGILLKIREMHNDLNPSEKKVASYIMDFPQETINMSIADLSKKCGASNSAVVRLCKTLGYSGYRELIVAITTDVAGFNDDDQYEYTDIQAGDDLETIIKNTCHNNKKSIEDTQKVLDYYAVEKAVEAIIQAKRVDFYGVGASSIICMDACQKFLRINKHCNAYLDYHIQMTSAATLSKEDVAIIISYSGNTQDIIDIMNIAKNMGATIIAITKYGKNTVSENADIVLALSSPETTIRIGAMGSRIAQLNVIDIIFSAVASKQYKHVKKYMDITHKIISYRKK